MTPLQWHYLKVKSESENNWKLRNSRCNQLKPGHHLSIDLHDRRTCVYTPINQCIDHLIKTNE